MKRKKSICKFPSISIDSIVTKKKRKISQTLINKKKIFDKILNTPIIYFKGKNLVFPKTKITIKNPIKFKKTTSKKPRVTFKKQKVSIKENSLNSIKNQLESEHTDYLVKNDSVVSKTKKKKPRLSSIRLRVLIKNKDLIKDHNFMKKFNKSRKKVQKLRDISKNQINNSNKNNQNFLNYFFYKRQIEKKRRIIDKPKWIAFSGSSPNMKFYQKTKLGKIKGYIFDSINLKFQKFPHLHTSIDDSHFLKKFQIPKKKIRFASKSVERRNDSLIKTPKEMEQSINNYIYKRLPKHIKGHFEKLDQEHLNFIQNKEIFKKRKSMFLKRKKKLKDLKATNEV